MCAAYGSKRRTKNDAPRGDAVFIQRAMRQGCRARQHGRAALFVALGVERLHPELLHRLRTHVLEVAEKLCDQVAIIKGGKLIRSGTMAEVKGDDSLEEVFLELEDVSC